MITLFVELTGEEDELARAEAISAAEALGGGESRGPSPLAGLLAIELAGEKEAAELSPRLSLARRCLLPLARGAEIAARLHREGTRQQTAAVRRFGSPRGAADPRIRSAGDWFRESGGRIDLDRPERRFWLAADARGTDWLLEEIGEVDREALARRRMPRMPFQRPVSLPPPLGRAAANLARVRAGDRVLDPFVGTGALLAESGLLGARLYGIDRDATMVRGTIANLQHLGLEAEALVAGDAGEVEVGRSDLRFHAIVTDPPYGRSSATGGEPTETLLERVLPRWARRVEPGGRIVVIVPAGAPPLDGVGTLERAIARRVHRSLTREFRVYAAPT